ncbi:hypothetical protein B0H19DRAFT_1259679 [Mycena capillaripes]|nr:hypothetical protein B0H19DRAFT_1259679 [Mycena capillaripes]
MHQSFHVRNLGRLPVSLRRIALPAAEGSVEHLKRILDLVSARLTEAHQEFLSVCWPSLDPSSIPSPEDLEIIDMDVIRRPVLGLQLMRNITDVPKQALFDVWPRVWAWIDFLYAHREAITGGPSELIIIGGLFGFIDRIPVSVVDTQVGVRVLVPKAGRAFIATGDPDIAGYVEFGRFINSGAEPIPHIHVSDYVDGAVRNLSCIRNGVMLAFNVERYPAEPFHAALRSQGLVTVLTDLMCELTRLFPHKDVPVTLRLCTELLWAELFHPSGYLYVPKAIRHGLLCAIVTFATCDTRDSDNKDLRRLLHEIKLSTVYYSVLRELEKALPEAETLVEAGTFSTPSIFPQWQGFVLLAKDRLRVKTEYFDSEGYVSYGACDNLECGAIQEKEEIASLFRVSDSVLLWSFMPKDGFCEPSPNMRESPFPSSRRSSDGAEQILHACLAPRYLQQAQARHSCFSMLANAVVG